GRDAQADALGALRQLAADPADFQFELGDVRADAGPHLDDRLVELAFDLIAERGGARRQQLGHMGSQFPGLGIDDLEFLLDADGEGVAHGGIIVQQDGILRRTWMSSERPALFPRTLDFAWLLLILLVALAARLWSLDAGVPHAVGIDEPQVVDRA